MGAKRSHHDKTKPGVYHIVALPITLKKSIFRQKENYENSNISQMQKYTQSSKNPIKKNQILQDIIINL
jgi:hypothetical protein